MFNMPKDVTTEMRKAVIFDIFLEVLVPTLDSSTNLAGAVDQFVAGQYSYEDFFFFQKRRGIFFEFPFIFKEKESIRKFSGQPLQNIFRVFTLNIVFVHRK